MAGTFAFQLAEFLDVVEGDGGIAGNLVILVDRLDAGQVQRE